MLGFNKVTREKNHLCPLFWRCKEENKLDGCWEAKDADADDNCAEHLHSKTIAQNGSSWSCWICAFVDIICGDKRTFAFKEIICDYGHWRLKKDSFFDREGTFIILTKCPPNPGPGCSFKATAISIIAAINEITNNTEKVTLLSKRFKIQSVFPFGCLRCEICCFRC